MITNHTPHEINVYDEHGRKLFSTGQPSQDQVARVDVKYRKVSSVFGAPLMQAEYGEVSGLPDPEEGVFRVVSLLVKQALPSRSDLVSPGELLRDESGQPIGCKGFVL